MPGQWASSNQLVAGFHRERQTTIELLIISLRLGDGARDEWNEDELFVFKLKHTRDGNGNVVIHGRKWLTLVSMEDSHYTVMVSFSSELICLASLNAVMQTLIQDKVAYDMESRVQLYVFTCIG